MTISELVYELEKIKNKHGDIDVLITDGGVMNPPYSFEVFVRHDDVEYLVIDSDF
jgi:hypothetical protein